MVKEKSVEYLYGLPVYKDNLDSKKYKKLDIVSQIEKNYNISNVRNNWSKNSYVQTDIHHSLDDENNKNFNKINYHNLQDLYGEIINEFFKKLNLKESFKFNFNIVNYTCSKHNSFMAPHIHKDSSFSLIHYVSFDNKEHVSTIFKSPYYFSNLLFGSDKLRSLFCNKSIENSWLYNQWVLETKEDDVVIVPAIIEHYVRNFDSNKSRITIVANINIEEKN